MTARHTALALLVPVIWGFNFVVIHWGLGEISPFVLLAVRFVLVALPLAFFLPKPAVSWTWLLAIGGFMSLGQFGLLYLSMNAGLPTGLAGLILQAQVPFTLLLGVVFLRESPRRAQWVGLALALVGLGVIGVGTGGHIPAIALILVLFAALSWAIGNVTVRAAGVQGGLGLTVWSGMVVPIPALAIALVVDGPSVVGHQLMHFGWTGVLSTLYTALLASLVGYGIFNSLLGRYPAGAVVPFALLVPIVSMLSAWWVLDEKPTVTDLVGGAVLLVGALVALRAASRPEDSGVTRQYGRWFPPKSASLPAGGS